MSTRVKAGLAIVAILMLLASYSLWSQPSMSLPLVQSAGADAPFDLARSDPRQLHVDTGQA